MSFGFWILRMREPSFVPRASGAKSAVLGFPQVEHLFKTAHQAGFDEG
jgi:hypothetical protein